MAIPKVTHVMATGYLIEAFNAVWHKLARSGACDASGSTEYRRVVNEFLSRDLAGEIEKLIRESANRPAVDNVEQTPPTSSGISPSCTGPDAIAAAGG